MQLTDMLLEVEVPTEPLSAGRARVGFAVCVRVHVERQIVKLVESFAAQATLVLLVDAVSQTVIFIVS